MHKLSIIIAGRHSTSISLEEEFVHELKQIAAERNMSVNQLVSQIDSAREHDNLSSAIRVFILRELKARMVDDKNIDVKMP